MTETTTGSDPTEQTAPLEAILGELSRIEDQIDGLVDARDLLANRLEHCADQFLRDHPEHDHCCCSAGRYGYDQTGYRDGQASLRFVTKCSWCNEGRGTDVLVPGVYADMVLAGDTEGLEAYRAKRQDALEAAERRQADDERAARQRAYEQLRQEFEPEESV